MARKVKTILLCLTMLVSVLLAGCQTTTDQDVTSAATATPQSQATSAPTQTPQAPESQEPIELMVYMTDRPAGTSDARVYNDVQAHIAELSGYILNMIPYQTGAETDKLNIMLSTQEPLDVFIGGWPTYSADGAIQPLTELLAEFGPDISQIWPEEGWRGMTDNDGVIWGIPRLLPVTTYPMYFRADWAEDLNLTIPTGIEGLEEYMAAIKAADPAGNGETIVMQTRLAGLNNCLAAGFMGTGYGHWQDDQGVVHYSSVDNPGYKDFVELMADWYKKGYIFKESFGSYDVRATIKADKVAIVADWYSVTTIAQVEEFYQNAGEDASYVYNEAGFTGPEGLCETMGSVSVGGYVVPYYSDKAADVVKFYNWCAQDTTNYVTQAEGIEGVHWEWADKDAGEMVKLEVAEEMKYINDFFIVKGLAFEMKVRYFEDPLQVHYDYIVDGKCLEYDRCARTVDWDMVYDTVVMEEAVPTMPDVDTMITQEVVKFITGVRPMSEWDAFIAELNAIGLDKLNTEVTRQYNDMKD